MMTTMRPAYPHKTCGKQPSVVFAPKISKPPGTMPNKISTGTSNDRFVGCNCTLPFRKLFHALIRQKEIVKISQDLAELEAEL